MEHEFFFTPKALSKATRDGILKGLNFLVSFAVVIFLIWKFEPRWKVELQNGYGYMIIIAIYYIGITIGGARKQVKITRVFFTEDSVNFTRKSLKIKIPFSNLSKITSKENGPVSIYIKSSNSIPAITFYNLDKTEDFLEILSQYAPVIRSNEIAFTINPKMQSILLFTFYSTFLSMLFFFKPILIFTSGTILTVLLIYTISIRSKMKSIYSTGVISIGTILLFGLIFLRFGFALREIFQGH
jgi:hypothetical protein